MRDIVLTAFLFGSLPFVLKRPTYGVYLWVWVSVMSPHRLTWGFAYEMPFALLIAGATLLGMLFSKEPKRLPMTPPVTVLFLMVLWMSVSTVFAGSPETAMTQWEKVIKIQFMVFITLYLLHSRQQVHTLVWVIAGSVAYYGIKGGLFTLRLGGEQRVYGPAGSYIEENNALAVAVIMTIPLLRYLLQQATEKWVRRGLVVAMVACGLSVLGSQSRGALLGVSAMLAFLWAKSRNKLVTAVALVLLVPLAIGFMPASWEARMRTMQTYEEDSSAMGRINAWTMALGIGRDHPFVGGGFGAFNAANASLYIPDATGFQGAHSIYFQMLGEHGVVGLLLFLLLWLLVWRDASWIHRRAHDRDGWRWASDLARMVQVSLVGYAVGGAFLNLAYWDVPYYLVVAIVITRLLVEKEIGEQPAAVARGRDRLAAPRSVVADAPPPAHADKR